MFFKTLAVVFLTTSISVVGAAELFKVAPYTLKHTNGRLLLNFQLNETKKLQIEDGQRVTKSFEYKKDQHYQTELGGEACGGMKDLRIVDSSNNAVVFDKTFPPSVCSSEARPEFTFGFISDTQEFTNRHEAIAKVIAAHNATDPMQFLINGGDVVQNGQIESEWIEFFKGGSSYLMDIPQIAAIGNHDYRGSKKNVVPAYFQKYMRWENSPANGNLFFDMPGFQLVILNSNFPELSCDQEKEIWSWMETKMANAQKAGIPLIVATHFPVHSSSLNKFTSSPVRKLRKHLMPLAEAYGVKLILSGHTHMYERSYKDGVNYLVAGPAGGRVNKPTGKNPYKQYFNASVLTFTKVKYSNKAFKIETYNEENILIDQLYINL